MRKIHGNVSFTIVHLLKYVNSGRSFQSPLVSMVNSEHQSCTLPLFGQTHLQLDQEGRFKLPRLPWGSSSLPFPVSSTLHTCAPLCWAFWVADPGLALSPVKSSC